MWCAAASTKIDPSETAGASCPLEIGTRTSSSSPPRPPRRRRQPPPSCRAQFLCLVQRRSGGQLHLLQPRAAISCSTLTPEPDDGSVKIAPQGAAPRRRRGDDPVAQDGDRGRRRRPRARGVGPRSKFEVHGRAAPRARPAASSRWRRPQYPRAARRAPAGAGRRRAAPRDARAARDPRASLTATVVHELRLRRLAYAAAAARDEAARRAPTAECIRY